MDFHSRHRGNKPVSPARQRFDVSRRVDRIAYHFANAGNGIVKTMIEVNESVVRPDLRSKFVARHDIARTIQQGGKYLERLALQSEFYAVFPELARAGIQFEYVEAKSAKGWCGRSHNEARKFGKPITILTPVGSSAPSSENVFVLNSLGMEKTLGTNGGNKD